MQHVFTKQCKQAQNRKMQIKNTFVGAVSGISIVGNNKQAGKQTKCKYTKYRRPRIQISENRHKAIKHCKIKNT